MIYSIRFTTRISGYYKVAYRNETLFLEASSKKAAKEIFESLLVQQRYSTTIIGRELGRYYLPKEASEYESRQPSKNLFDTFERRVYQGSELKAKADNWLKTVTERWGPLKV